MPLLIQLLEKRSKREEKALDFGGAVIKVESIGDFAVVVAIVPPPRSIATASVRAAARFIILCRWDVTPLALLLFAGPAKAGRAWEVLSREERERERKKGKK